MHLFCTYLSDKTTNVLGSQVLKSTLYMYNQTTPSLPSSLVQVFTVEISFCLSFSLFQIGDSEGIEEVLFNSSTGLTIEYRVTYFLIIRK